MFEIVNRLKGKTKNIYGEKPITIAFLGDSVTQGCFECYLTSPTTLETVYDYKSAFSTRVKEILNILYPNVQINIINSGLNGDNAFSGVQRMERDVLNYHPDLLVVSYGLNDSTQGMEGLTNYKKSLSEIFIKAQREGVEVVFLTENIMNTKVSPHLKEKLFVDLAKEFSGNIQNNGVLHTYFEAAKEVCQKHGIRVCDLHSVWERMNEIGIDTTELLSNKLNHPLKEFHYYIAIKLIETIFL